MESSPSPLTDKPVAPASTDQRIESTLPVPSSGEFKDESYFTGSSNAEDYIIDLTLPADRQPVDVQAYVELIGIDLRSKQFPDDPRWDHNNSLPKWRQPYTPRWDLITEGLQALVNVSQSKEHGFWMQASDIIPEDMARFPHNPWLASLLRTTRLRQIALDLEEAYKRKSWRLVIYTNVRQAFPDGLKGPEEDNGWLSGTRSFYGSQHLVKKYAKSTALELENLSDGDVVQATRFIVSPGIRHAKFGVYPCPDWHQEMFDEDPQDYSDFVWELIRRGEPVPEAPVGWAEFNQKKAAERERANNAERPAQEDV